MAGWKLRKDKTQAETAATEPETAVEPVTAEPMTTEPMTTEPMTTEGGAEIYSAPAADEEAPMQWGTPVETEHAPSFDMETGGDLHFADEEGPLKLMDYSAPFTEDLLPLSAASAEPIIAAPPVETPPAEMPTLATPSFDTSLAEPGEADGDFTSTLRMSREELASVLAPPPPSGVPPVAPFVLDTPLVSPATEETPPRLVVRMGRLSAAFDLTKEVTIIGRPDSEMHYYPDVEIDMDDAVSRRHAEIIQRGATYSLVDTGSTNGTLLNGETLPAHEERLLTHGDRIRVGERTEIIFE